MAGSCHAAEEAATPEDNTNPMEFSISVKPEKSAAEKEFERWTPIMANETGTYLFEDASIKQATTESGKTIRNQKVVLTRSVFKSEEVLAKMDAFYAKQLGALNTELTAKDAETELMEEKIGYCDMLLQFDLRKQNYRVLSTQVYTQTGKLVDNRQKSGPWKKVPGKSFADNLMKFLINKDKYGL